MPAKEQSDNYGVFSWQVWTRPGRLHGLGGGIGGTNLRDDKIEAHARGHASRSGNSCSGRQAADFAATAIWALCVTLRPLLLCSNGANMGVRMDDVISKLTAEQALKIIERLSRKGSQIRKAVLIEALNVLTEIDLDETADEVFAVLDSIDVQDCWDRSGSSRDGYTSPDEAAAEIIEEELQPFFEQVERYHEMGLPEQEATFCKGVIFGIYRYERESKSEFRGWSVDIPAECGGFLLDKWRERNREKDSINAMHELSGSVVRSGPNG